MSFFRRYRYLVLRAAGTILLLVGIMWIIDVKAAWATMRTLEWHSAVSISLIALASWGIAIVKWKLLLRAIPIWELAQFHFVGMLYNQILPGQLAGEAVKAVRLAHGRKHIQLSTITASVIVDRLTGLIALGLVSGFGLLFSTLDTISTRWLGLIISGLTIIFAVVLFSARVPLLIRLASRVQVWADDQRGLQGRLGRGLHRLFGAWHDLVSNWSLTWTSIALGIAFQLTAVLAVKVIAESVGAELAFGDAAWVLGVVSVAVLVPISLGGLGVRELGFVAMLALCGVEPALALSIGIISSFITIAGALIGLALEAAPISTKMAAK